MHKEKIIASCYCPNRFFDYDLKNFFIETDEGDKILDVSEIDLIEKKEEIYQEIKKMYELDSEIKNLGVIKKLELRFRNNAS